MGARILEVRPQEHEPAPWSTKPGNLHCEDTVIVDSVYLALNHRGSSIIIVHNEGGKARETVR